MAGPTAAEQALKDGDPQIAIKHLQAQIRKQPADAKLRVFLFQLLCVQCDWSRALNQLTVACELDISTLPMVQTYHIVDISVKKLEIQRKGEDGLVCRYGCRSCASPSCLLDVRDSSVPRVREGS